MPTLRDFTEQIRTRHGIAVQLYEAIGPRGTTAIRIFVRSFEDERATLTAPLPGVLDDERLRPTVVRSLCRQLAIDVVEFGLVRDEVLN